MVLGVVIVLSIAVSISTSRPKSHKSSKRTSGPVRDSGGDAGDDSDGTSYNPCQGLREGDDCKSCPRDDSDCMESTELKKCKDGKCLPASQ